MCVEFQSASLPSAPPIADHSGPGVSGSAALFQSSRKARLTKGKPGQQSAARQRPRESQVHRRHASTSPCPGALPTWRFTLLPPHPTLITARAPVLPLILFLLVRHDWTFLTGTLASCRRFRLRLVPALWPLQLATGWCDVVGAGSAGGVRGRRRRAETHTCTLAERAARIQTKEDRPRFP